MTERQFFRISFLRVLVLIAVIGAAGIAGLFALDKGMDVSILQNANRPHRAEDVQAVVPEGAGVQAEVTGERNGRMELRIRPEKGMRRGSFTIAIRDKSTGETVSERYLYAGAFGRIYDRATGNFTNYRYFTALTLLFYTGLAMLMWYSFFDSLRKLVYSYQSIFYAGFGMWITVIAGFLIAHYIRGSIVMSTVDAIKESPLYFVLFTLPLILLYSTALTISNLSLIRHEGFRWKNALGIMLSVLLLGGAMAGILMGMADFRGSETAYNARMAFVNAFLSVYTLFECFLFASALCGFIAARREPDAPADYIIILGCRIRADGSLYPLIRGRVERAVRLWREQEAEGNNAYLIPSGGKGRDEPIAEASAMQAYLIENGIPRDRILPEDRSANTAENMRFSRDIIEKQGNGKNAVFATTNYHVFRSGVIARQAGLDAMGVASRTRWYYWPNAFIRECAGMSWWLRGRLSVILALLIVFFAAIQFII